MQFLSALDRLSASTSIELREDIGGVSFDGTYGNEKLVGDLLIRQTLSDEFEDLVLPFTNSNFSEIRFIEKELRSCFDDLRPC